MIPTRTAEWIVSALIALGVVALIAAALTAPQYGTMSASAQWAEWRRMSASERISYARMYEDLSRTDEGCRALSRAADFAALTDSERNVLRAIDAAIRETMSSPHGAAFRDSVPTGEARARTALQIMQQHFPETLERLRATVR